MLPASLRSHSIISSHLLYAVYVYRLYFIYNTRTDNRPSVSDISYVKYKFNFAHSMLTVSSKERYQSEINGEYDHYEFPSVKMIRALQVNVNTYIAGY